MLGSLSAGFRFDETISDAHVLPGWTAKHDRTEVYLKSGHEDKAWKLNIGVFKIRKGKTWVHREKEKFIAMSLKPVQ